MMRTSWAVAPSWPAWWPASRSWRSWRSWLSCITRASLAGAVPVLSRRVQAVEQPRLVVGDRWCEREVRGSLEAPCTVARDLGHGARDRSAAIAIGRRGRLALDERGDRPAVRACAGLVARPGQHAAVGDHRAHGATDA